MNKSRHGDRHSERYFETEDRKLTQEEKQRRISNVPNSHTERQRGKDKERHSEVEQKDRDRETYKRAINK